MRLCLTITGADVRRQDDLKRHRHGRHYALSSAIAAWTPYLPQLRSYPYLHTVKSALFISPSTGRGEKLILAYLCLARL